MRKLLLAGVASAAAFATTTPAHAHPDWHYGGSCGFFVISNLDGTDPPVTRWDGEIHLAAIATDSFGSPQPTAGITVECELRINGVSHGIVAAASDWGVVVDGGPFHFYAEVEDVITMCDLVTVNGDHHKDCGAPTQP